MYESDAPKRLRDKVLSCLFDRDVGILQPIWSDDGERMVDWRVRPRTWFVLLGCIFSFALSLGGSYLGVSFHSRMQAAERSSQVTTPKVDSRP